MLCQAKFEITLFSDEKAFSVHVAHRTALPVTHLFADPAIAVSNHEIREAMNHLTRAPNGTETLPGSESFVSSLFRHLGFNMLLCERYKFGHLSTMYKNKPGVVLVWNKNNFSKVHVMDHQRVALDKLNPQHWTTVFYWNDSGKMPPRPQAPADNPVAMMDLSDPPGQPPHPGLGSE